MGKLKAVLNDINILYIDPKSNPDEVAIIICSALAGVGNKEEINRLNEFYQTITNSKDDFSKIDLLEIIELTANFIKRSGNVILKLIQINQDVLNKVIKNMTAQSEKTIQETTSKAMKKIMNSTNNILTSEKMELK